MIKHFLKLHLCQQIHKWWWVLVIDQFYIRSFKVRWLCTIYQYIY